MSRFGLEDRVAIVTGATRGLGRAVVDGLVGEGALVVAVAGSDATATNLRDALAASGERVTVIAQDLRGDDAGERIVTTAIERWGRLDVLINNAAPARRESPDIVLERADWEEIFRAKLLAYWSLMAAAIPELTERRGAIVNVAGGAALVASPGSPHIAAMNAAIISLSESYALKLARSGVRVNVVTPSVIDNERFAARAARRAAATGTTIEAARAELADRIPVGFPTSTKEIADVILHLASPTARSLTGANVVVGGASHLRGHGGG